MKRTMLLLLAVLMVKLLPAQINWDYKTWETGIHQNMLITNLTFAVGKAPAELKYYVYTSAEWTLTDHFGIEGAVFFNAGSSEDDAASLLNYEQVIDPGQADYRTHNLFFGPNYHFFDRKRVDLYAGVHPGVTFFTAPAYDFVDGGENRSVEDFQSLEPSVSFNLGLAYYAKFFHAFVQGRQVVGRLESREYSGKLNDFRVAIGLGFNLF